MAHRDGFPRLSARSAWRGDAGHREPRRRRARKPWEAAVPVARRTAGVRRKALTMPRIACGSPPARRIARAISMGHYRALLGIREIQAMEAPNTYQAEIDDLGHFGHYVGRFVAETLMPLITSRSSRPTRPPGRIRATSAAIDDFAKHYVGRPSPLYFAERLTEHFANGNKGAKLYFKRDELNHTGSHKINNCLGQILLARRMGKTRIIAETGAGPARRRHRHGLCALPTCPAWSTWARPTSSGRQPNVFRMKLLGAEVVPVTSGTGTLKDAMNDALRDWVANVENTFYIIGTVAGPHPYPAMVRDFQSVIGHETREQMHGGKEGRLPDTLIACIGGGSNAMGLFHPFLDDAFRCASIGVEAAGHGIETGKHAASIAGGRPGVLHGNRTFLLQTDDGQIIRRPFDFRRTRLSRASGRSIPGCTRAAAPNTSRRPTPRPWTRSKL